MYVRGSVTTRGGCGQQSKGSRLWRQGEGRGTNALMFGSYIEKHKVEPNTDSWTPLLMPQPPKPLKTVTAESFVLLTGSDAATSSLITSPQTWGSLINPSE